MNIFIKKNTVFTPLYYYKHILSEMGKMRNGKLTKMRNLSMVSAMILKDRRMRKKRR